MGGSYASFSVKKPSFKMNVGGNHLQKGQIDNLFSPRARRRERKRELFLWAEGCYSTDKVEGIREKAGN